MHGDNTAVITAATRSKHRYIEWQEVLYCRQIRAGVVSYSHSWCCTSGSETRPTVVDLNLELGRYACIET